MTEQVPGRVGDRDDSRRAIDLAAKNERLVQALTAARTQLVELRAQLEEMTKPRAPTPRSCARTRTDRST